MNSYLDISTLANPCTEVTIDSKTTTYIGSEYVEIAGKRFSSKQLAYLLSKLLDEHPECQIWEVSYSTA